MNETKYTTVDNLVLIPAVMVNEHKMSKAFTNNIKRMSGKSVAKFAMLNNGGLKNILGTSLNHNRFGVKKNSRNIPHRIRKQQSDSSGNDVALNTLSQKDVFNLVAYRKKFFMGNNGVRQPAIG
jgi:hypothetical protein